MINVSYYCNTENSFCISIKTISQFILYQDKNYIHNITHVKFIKYSPSVARQCQEQDQASKNQLRLSACIAYDKTGAQISEILYQTHLQAETEQDEVSPLSLSPFHHHKVGPFHIPIMFQLNNREIHYKVLKKTSNPLKNFKKYT